MSAITFDSLKFVKRLTNAGIPQDQAEAQVLAFQEAHEENLDQFATKEDLKDLNTNLKTEMSELATNFRSEMSELATNLRSEMSELKISLIKWMLSISFTITSAQTAIIFGVFKSLH